jgi:hypothetical protein
MGWSISWLAVKDTPPQELLAHFGLEPGGESGVAFDSPISFKACPSGWSILALQRFEHKFLAAEHAKALSAGHDFICCSLDDRVMVSASEGWRDGTRLWRVVHNAEEEVEEFQEVEVSGSPPAALDEILATLRKEHEEDKEGGVDYFFDAPIRLAEALTGFAHDHAGDEETKSPVENFKFVIAPPAAKRRWFFW